MQTQISRQMKAVILFIIGIPLIEIYLMIKVGSVIGAFNTIFLIFFTAVRLKYPRSLNTRSPLRTGISIEATLSFLE